MRTTLFLTSCLLLACTPKEDTRTPAEKLADAPIKGPRYSTQFFSAADQSGERGSLLATGSMHFREKSPSPERPITGSFTTSIDMQAALPYFEGQRLLTSTGKDSSGGFSYLPPEPESRPRGTFYFPNGLSVKADYRNGSYYGTWQVQGAQGGQAIISPLAN